MKNSILLMLLIFLGGNLLNAQSKTELEELKNEKEAAIADLQGKINTLQAEVDGIESDIALLKGWSSGIAGIIGFDLSHANGWASSPNPNASSTALNIGLSAYANKDNKDYFWNNKAIITKAWQDVDLVEDEEGEEDGLLDNGTVDILNIQSLFGYKLNSKLALSAMGDMNTSIENFLDPGTVDIGAGVTWLPVNNMTVVVHPLNYHFTFSGIEGVGTESTFGAKIRVDYASDFLVSGKAFNFNTTLMSFIPYSGPETDDDPSMFEYTWLNTLSFSLWKGFGVGIGFGLRQADFELEESQSYQTVGVSYAF